MTTHDYTWSGWGHAIHLPQMVIKPLPQSRLDRLLRRPPKQDEYMTALIHGRDFAPGDALLLKMESGKIGRFIIREVEWLHNPKDMWSIKRADFDGYAPAQAIEARKGQDRHGLDRNDESAVAKPCAQGEQP